MDLIPYIFHEKQEGNLCAQHCLNALLQSPIFTAPDLANLAMKLDKLEQDAMSEGSASSSSSSFFNKKNKKFESQNMDDTGYFSSQVLLEALKVFNLTMIPWNHPDLSLTTKKFPEREVAFICHLENHWYTLRRVGPSIERWYDLNSLKPKPVYMSDTFLGLTLNQLEQEGYSIFVIKSSLTPEEERVKRAREEEEQQQQNANRSASSSLSGSSVTATVPVVQASVPAPKTFLSERQEMERIRQQRIKDQQQQQQQQQGGSQSPSPATSTPTPAPVEAPKQSLLVPGKSILPPCEADRRAIGLPSPKKSADDVKGVATESFSGAGYRLNAPVAPPPSSTQDGFSEADFGDGDDTEAAMMQHAIEMSLRA